MAIAAPYRPDPKILDLGPEFYDPVEPARFPEAIPRFLNHRWAELVGLGYLDGAAWAAHFCRFEPLRRQPRSSRWRFAITGTSSACTIRTSATAAASSSPSFATTGIACSTSGTKGSGTDALQPDCGWAADAQGRSARSTSDRNARGARSKHVQDLRFVRNRRGTGARGRTLAHAIRRPDAPRPRPHPHRHVPAARLFRRGRQHQQAWSRYCLEHLYGEQAGRRRGRKRTAPVRSGCRQPRPGSRRATWRPASSMASSTATISTITGESFDYGPWRFTPDWDPDFHRRLFRLSRALFLRTPA